MDNDKSKKKESPFSLKALLTGFIFGVIALAIVLGELHIPIPGTEVVTDPREIFTTLGAAFSGPVGGIIVGFLAGIAEPGGIPLASLLAHISGCIWMGFAYKKLVYTRLQMPARLLGWIGIVLVYYFVFAVAGFAIGLTFFYGDKTPIIQQYLAISKGVIWETSIAIVVTTLVWFALPSKYTKPLW